MILLDLFMPDFDGWNCLVALNGDPVLRRVPVVLMTASESAVVRARAEGAGVAGYLPKPFLPAEMIDAIGSAVRRC